MEKKYEFMCVWSYTDACFTKGKIYTSDFEKGQGFIDDCGYQYNNLRYNEYDGVKFIPVEQLLFKVICTEEPKYKFCEYVKGETYFVTADGCYIYDDYGFKDDYKELLINGSFKFKIVENYKTKKEEENKMSSLEKNGLVKGLGQTMIQDTFRTVTDKKTGMIQLNPVKMKNICFVRFKTDGKVYMFENPSDRRLKQGMKVQVETCMGKQDAYVVSSMKIQQKYEKDLKAALGAEKVPLKKVVGIYEMVEVEALKELDEKNAVNHKQVKEGC